MLRTHNLSDSSSNLCAKDESDVTIYCRSKDFNRQRYCNIDSGRSRRDSFHFHFAEHNIHLLHCFAEEERWVLTCVSILNVEEERWVLASVSSLVTEEERWVLTCVSILDVEEKRRVLVYVSSPFTEKERRFMTCVSILISSSVWNTGCTKSPSEVSLVLWTFVSKSPEFHNKRLLHPGDTRLR